MEGEDGLRLTEENEEGMPLGVGDGGAKEEPSAAEAVVVERDRSVAECDLLIERRWAWRTGEWVWPSSASALAFPV